MPTPTTRPRPPGRPWGARFPSALLAASVALAGGPLARAQSDRPEPGGRIARFDALVQRGVASFRSGRYLEAARAFEQAYAIDPQPALVYNQARSFERALESDRAIAAYERFIQLPGTTAALRAKALETLDALRREQVARAARRVPTRDFMPAPSAPVPSAPTGSADLSTAAPTPEPDRTVEWALVGGGAALVAGGAIAGALALGSEADFDDALERRVPRAELEDLQARAEDRARIADVLLVSGAAAAATGLVLFLVRRGPEPGRPVSGGSSGGRSLSVGPMLAPEGAGLVLDARF